METLEAVGWTVVTGVCVGSVLAPLLLAVFEGSFLEQQESAAEGAEGGDSDGG